MFRQRRFWLGRPLAAVEMAGGLFALTTDLQVRQLAALLEPWSAASPATREEGSEAGAAWMRAMLNVVDEEQLHGLRRCLRLFSGAQAPAVEWDFVDGGSAHAALRDIVAALEAWRVPLSVSPQADWNQVMEAARRLINAAADAVFILPDGWLLPHDTLDEHVVRAVRLRQARAEFEDAPIKCLRQRLVRHHNMMSLRVASLAGEPDVRWGYYQIMTTELGRPEPAPTTCGFPGCCERRGLRKVGATGQELPVVHLCDAVHWLTIR